MSLAVSFHPKRNNLPGIILELKAGSTPQEAISQIRKKEYCEKLKKKNITSILGVGICYDPGRKEHTCEIVTM